jgi:hypothetical protein
VELALLHPIRKLSDGLTVLECRLNADWYMADHNPIYEFVVIFLNIMILELRIYNVNHKEET